MCVYPPLSFFPSECPPEADPNDLCQAVPAIINLNLVNESDPDAIVEEYEAALMQAIEEGRLQAELDSTSPQSPVTILTSMIPTEPPTPREGISAGGIAGIVIAFAVICIPLGIVGYKERQKSISQKKDYEPYEKDHDDERDDSEDRGGQSKGSIPKFEPKGSGSNVGAASFGPSQTAAMLGATQADYGRASRKAMEAMAAGEDIVAEPELDAAPDESSSNAGSSGWSSSAGISSLNTGSIDDSMDAAAAAGATLAAIGATSALTRKQEADQKSKSALYVIARFFVVPLSAARLTDFIYLFAFLVFLQERGGIWCCHVGRIA